jgi:hypothetical protein
MNIHLLFPPKFPTDMVVIFLNAVDRLPMVTSLIHHFLSKHCPDALQKGGATISF